jgi:hypothetical protein
VTDDLVPFADPIRLPAPADLKDTLRLELSRHVTAERAARGDVTQPEDVSPLVRALARAKDAFGEYANAFSSAAALAKKELDEELTQAVGEKDGVPMGNLTVPDLDGTDIRFGLNFTNSHAINEQTVLAAIVGNLIDDMIGNEPVQDDGETDDDYDSRYWRWFQHVVERAITDVLAVGSYSMQVSKVKAFSATLAGQGKDTLAAVVRGAINTTRAYGGIKMERKTRKETP